MYKKLPSLTAGRGLAAIGVAAYHGSLMWKGWLEPVFRFGWLGVTFFFILSGFVLTWSFSNKQTYKEFIVHRLARIYPVHIICMFISIASFVYFGAAFGGYIGTISGAILSFFLLHDFIPGHPNIRQGWNGVSWSLSVEFFFYLFAPMLIRRLNEVSSSKLINFGLSLYILHLALGCMAFKLHLTHFLDFMQYYPLAYFPIFIYGVIAAILLRRGLVLKIGWVVRVGLFIPVLVYCYNLPDADSMAMIALTVPAFLCLIIDWASQDLADHPTILSKGIFERVGVISYSLYMSHALVLAYMGLILSVINIPYRPTLFVFVFVLLSLFVANLMYELYERPMRNYILSHQNFYKIKKV